MPLLGLLVIGFGIMHIVAPEKVWRFTEAWKYRNPEANEPSDISYAMQRVSGAVMVGIGLWVLSWSLG
jgi:hypothetical protein